MSTMRICTPLVVLLTLLSGPCFSQKPNVAGSATATGSCNTAVVGDNNQITINCQSKLQADKMLAIMNKILANQLDPDMVTKKLDEILAARNSVNQNCPNGICAGGDITGNPTVYNAAPQRRLSTEQKTALVSCLQQNPGKFSLSALQNNSESYKYAQDWYDVFTLAHWSNELPIPISIFVFGNGMWSGMKMSISGDWDQASQKAILKEGSPEKDAFVCIRNVRGIAGAVIPDKGQPTGTMRIIISDQPVDSPKTAP
jgi:hypothetical protein